VSTDAIVRQDLIWATRGWSWGFRFLLDGGLADPLFDYEELFGELQDETTGWRRAAGRIALRFPDPLGRSDAAGRVIPHDFVVLRASAADVESVEDGLRRVWPLVAETYARVWDTAVPPSAADLR
jgi:hypothetical protein